MYFRIDATLTSCCPLEDEIYEERWQDHDTWSDQRQSEHSQKLRPEIPADLQKYRRSPSHSRLISSVEPSGVHFACGSELELDRSGFIICSEVGHVFERRWRTRVLKEERCVNEEQGASVCLYAREIWSASMENLHPI